MFKLTKHLIMLLIMAVVVCTLAGRAGAQTKRPLNHDDYDNWVTIRGSGLSPDGNWIFYSVGSRNDDPPRLTIKNVEDNDIYQDIPVSGTPQFTYDSKYIIYNPAPTEEEVEKAKEEEQPEPQARLTLLRLDDGELTTIEKVESFRLPEESGDWLAYIEAKPEEEGEVGGVGRAGRGGQRAQRAGQRFGRRGGQRRQIAERRGGGAEDEGDTLFLKSLVDERTIKFENIASFRFTKDGSRLIYTAIDKEEGDKNGVFVYNPDNDETRPLLTGAGEYSGFTFDEDERRYVLLSTRDDPEPNDAPRAIYGGNLNRGRARRWVSHETTDGFPENMVVAGRGVSFRGDDAVTFSIDYDAETKKKMKEEYDQEKDQSEANFELWHWNDPYPYPQQKRMVTQMQNTARTAILHLDTRTFAVLTDDKITSVSFDDNATVALANDRMPYSKMVSYDGTYNDVYVVDTETGARRLIKKQLRGGARLSPLGQYLTWFVDKHYFVHDIANRITTNITENLDVNFFREDHDTPQPPGGYGIAGWTDDEKTILLYDKYDIWEIEPDGANPRRITEGFGRENDLSFRIIRIGPSDSSTVDPDDTLTLRTTNMETMAQGYYRDRVRGDRLPRRLIMLDKAIGAPRKATSANRYMFTRNSFDEFPDLWISNTRFGNMQKVSDVGKQLEQFIWGKAELRDFLSSDGKPLKGILIKPDNFDQANRYPLMIYIYETLHNGLHSFRNPGIGTSINIPYYVSNGYIVWQPDIEYGTGYPGQDALKCVLPGIQMLIGEGYIDPDAIGIQGHSWGGYQISYMVTQTNIFAAAEAGAPVSNMTSAYGGIRWSSGMVRQFQYEKTQSRLGASPWEVPLRYLENSPIFWADKVQTPLLILHNDQDGAVPWYQGIEYIMALRRLNKVAFMFNYVGEEHGLRQRENQRDFTIRMQEFFDHYLKGVPEPKWMTEGIQAWKK